MIPTRTLGTVVEYECAIHLMKLGCIVSKPLDESSPYDLIADYKNHLIRIQVKHSNEVSGGFQFSCESTQINSSRIEARRYSKESVDYFGTVYNETCYLVPIIECGGSKKLRLDAPENYSIKRINWAIEYEAAYILAKLEDPNASPRIDISDIISSYKKQIDVKNSQYGTIWITDGTINKKIKNVDDIPNGFWRGRSGQFKN